MIPFSLSKPTIRLMPLTGALTALLLVATLGACSSGPSLGDTIRAQGAELASIGDRWSEGDELIQEAEEQIEDGQDMILKGRKLTRNGEELVDEGNKNIQRGQELKRVAEASYRQKTGNELPTN
ncbi:MAG: hypothetical protein OEU92_24190 [Alphaproteobacteria bacterium]|nr:hypothetical protein [Alphaproteobacteria bacterium]